MSAPYTVEPMFYQPSKQNQAKIVLKRLTTKLEPEISRAQADSRTEIGWLKHAESSTMTLESVM